MVMLLLIRNSVSSGDTTTGQPLSEKQVPLEPYNSGAGGTLF